MIRDVQRLDATSARLKRARPPMTRVAATGSGNVPALTTTIRRSPAPAGHKEQLFAAASSVVWIAGFLQRAVNELTDSDDSL